jgi:hypothetical protein
VIGMGDNRHETYSLKPSGEGWVDSPDNRNVEQVVTLLQKFDPTPIDEAAISYRDAHKAVGEARDAIKEEAHKLAKVWEGNASVEAQKALGILYVTLGELADKLGKMAYPLSEFGDVVRGHQGFLNDDWKGFALPAWHYQGFWNMGGFTNGGSWNDDWTDYYGTYTGYYNERGERVDSTEGKWGSPNELAGRHLQTFGNDLKQIFYKMPDKLDETLRDINLPGGQQPPPPPVDYSFGDKRGVGSVTPTSYGNPDLTGYRPGGRDTDGPGSIDLPTGPPTQTDPNGPATNQPGDPSNGSPTNPGGQNPGGQNPGSQNPGSQNPGSATTQNLGQVPNPGANPTTNLQDFQRPPNSYGTPNGTFPTTNPPGYGTPNTPSFGPNGPGGPGTSGGPGGVYGGGVPTGAPTGGRAGGGPGMPFMPMGGMGGGAGGQESRDRESTTWLHEDDDVWGGDADSAVNHKIG